MLFIKKKNTIKTEFPLSYCKRNFKLPSNLHAKVVMLDSQWHPVNLYLTNIVGDIVVFLGLKLYNSDKSDMFSCNSKA